MELDSKILMGLTIKRLRAEKEMTQDSFIEKIGCTRATWSKIEAGKRDVTWQELETITKVFDIGMDDFMETIKVTEEKLALAISSHTKKNNISENGFMTGILMVGGGTLIALLLKLLIDYMDKED